MGSKVASRQNEQQDFQIKKEESQVQTDRSNQYSFITQKDVRINTIPDQGGNSSNQSNQKDSQNNNLVQSHGSSHNIQEQQVQKEDDIKNNEQNQTNNWEPKGSQLFGPAPVFNQENTQHNQRALFSIQEFYDPWLKNRLGQFGQYQPPEKFEDLESIKVDVADLPDGSKYEGFMKNGKMHGYGIHLLKNELFEGSFQDGIRKGWGRSITEDTLKSGFWDKDEIEKKMILQTQDVYYQGECSKSIPNGKGVLKKTTINYEGDFIKGRMHGKGVFEDNQQRIKYEGEFALDKFNGHGTFQFPSGIDESLD